MRMCWSATASATAWSTATRNSHVWANINAFRNRQMASLGVLLRTGNCTGSR